MDNSENKISKRQFLEWLAGGAALAGASVLAGCNSEDAVKPLGKAVSAGKKFGEMASRIHKRSQDKVSLLGYGCMRFPTITNGPKAGEIDEEMAQRLLDTAYAAGVNYYDTAYVYHGGKSEAFVGRALKKYPRKSFYLATKMPGRIVESLDHAKRIFEEQLANLQTDYIDYYLLHNINNLDKYKRVYEEYGVLDYLLEQKKQGRIRSLGWSFHGNSELFDYVLSLPVDWDFVQIQLNYHDWELGPANNDAKHPVTAKGMYDKLAARNIQVTIMEPLLGGSLASLPGGGNAILKEAAPQRSVASWAFRFCGSLPNVLTVLSGMTYIEHLEDNLNTFAPFEPLSEPERKALERALNVSDKAKRIPCTGCEYCMPCPFGVDIPGLFKHYNKCVVEAKMPQSSFDPNYAKARKEYLGSYERGFDSSAQADHCIGCGACLRKCPQRINIPSELENIQHFTENIRRSIS